MKKPNTRIQLQPTKYGEKAGFEIITPLLSATMIFLLTGMVGVWAAPSRSLALIYFVPFLLSVVFFLSLSFVTRHRTETAFGILGLICTIPIVLFTVYFGLTVNWTENLPFRFIPIQQLGLWIQGQNPELAGFPALQKNMVGTILVVLLPFGLSGAIWAWTRWFRFISAFAAMAILIGILGLLITSSRGAWLGLGLGIGYAAYFMWRTGKGSQSNSRWLVDLLVLGFTLAATTGFFVLLRKPELEPVLAVFLGESVSRISIWRDSITLIQDYPFTGGGLGSTAMIYSSYVFLLHVPFFFHAHNLYLQIAIEQGLPGLIAFAAMVLFTILGLVTIIRQGNSLNRVYSASTLAALMALLWHGVVEAELYAHVFRPIVFLPMGFTFMLLLGNATPQSLWGSQGVFRRANPRTISACLLPMVAIAILFLWPGAPSLFLSDLGAVAQTRAELSMYHWPEWFIQDELRRNDAVDLSAAIAYYEQALAINPGNVTADRRLGQIEISRGQYDAARQHLEAAYNLAPDQRATCQMLGEIDAINGDMEGAVSLWRLVDTSDGQLDIRQSWYTHIGAQQEAKRVSQAIARLKAVN